MKKRELNTLAEDQPGVAAGCAVAAVFVFAVGLGALLHTMTLAAGRNLVSHALIWVPLALLAYYLMRMVRSFRRLPRQTDSDFADRLATKLAELNVAEKEPPVPEEPAADEDSGESEDPAPTAPTPPSSDP